MLILSNTKKCCFILVLTFILGICNISNISLAAENIVLMVLNSESFEYSNSEFTYSLNGFELEASQFLRAGGVSIEKLLDKIRISGYTASYEQVDTIGIHLYLQIWDQIQSQWVDVKDLGEKSVHQLDKVEIMKDAIVSGGYYYRVRGLHYIIKGDIIEQSSSLTNYIYVE